MEGGPFSSKELFLFLPKYSLIYDTPPPPGL
jgi:hypothetical protein